MSDERLDDVTLDCREFDAALGFPSDRTAAVIRELKRLRAAVREHRDQRGDDRCWLDDEKLYQALPEGYTPPERDTTVELERCVTFIRNRRNPGTEYVSPQRRIEELEAEVARLQRQVAGHCDRIAAQSALLSKRAERTVTPDDPNRG